MDNWLLFSKPGLSTLLLSRFPPEWINHSTMFMIIVQLKIEKPILLESVAKSVGVFLVLSYGLFPINRNQIIR